MAKAKKLSLSQRNRIAHWYGMKKIARGQKVAWIAKADKNGWALGLTFGKRTLWLRNLRIADRKEVERIMEKSSLVFINLKNQ